MVFHRVGDGPQGAFQLGQEVARVELISLAVEGQAALIGQAAVGGPVAQGLELVDIQCAGDVGVPGIGAAAGEDGVRLRTEQWLQHGPYPVEQGFEGVNRVCAVLSGPELFNELTLGDVPVPVDQQIREYIPELLGTVGLISQYMSVHSNGKPAQHGNINVFHIGITHDRHLLSSVFSAKKKK